MRTVGSHTSFAFSSNSSYCLSLEYNKCTRKHSVSKENFRRWLKFLINLIPIFYKYSIVSFVLARCEEYPSYDIPRFGIYIIPLNSNFVNYSDCYSIIRLPLSYFIYRPNSIVASHILAYSILSYYLLEARPRIIC